MLGRRAEHVAEICDRGLLCLPRGRVDGCAEVWYHWKSASMDFDGIICIQRPVYCHKRQRETIAWQSRVLFQERAIHAHYKFPGQRPEDNLRGVGFSTCSLSAGSSSHPTTTHVAPLWMPYSLYKLWFPFVMRLDRLRQHGQRGRTPSVFLAWYCHHLRFLLLSSSCPRLSPNHEGGLSMACIQKSGSPIDRANVWALWIENWNTALLHGVIRRNL